CAVLGRLLANLDGRMMDEDYQVLLSDGQMFGQLWVLGAEDAAAGVDDSGCTLIRSRQSVSSPQFLVLRPLSPFSILRVVSTLC
ncbi:hypothetical protein D4764_18G0010050, partial [Takifugu flavidus]